MKSIENGLSKLFHAQHGSSKTGVFEVLVY
jgi:hypothetical protein